MEVVLVAPPSSNGTWKNFNLLMNLSSSRSAKASNSSQNTSRSILWESGAILSYLANKYDPTIDTPEKLAIVNQWVIFANSTLSDGIFAPQFQAKETPHLLGNLDLILSNQPYLIGETFSAADIAVGSLLGYIPMLLKEFDFTPYPNVMNYMQRLQERPAYE
jgi:glutathione S-transferase